MVPRRRRVAALGLLRNVPEAGLARRALLVCMTPHAASARRAIRSTEAAAGPTRLRVLIGGRRDFPGRELRRSRIGRIDSAGAFDHDCGRPHPDGTRGRRSERDAAAHPQRDAGVELPLRAARARREERGIRLFSYDRPGYGERPATRVAASPTAPRMSQPSAMRSASSDSVSSEPRAGGPRARNGGSSPRPCRGGSGVAPLAPFDAEGLDFYEGMGELNIEEFGVIFEGEEAHRAMLERERDGLLAGSPEDLVEGMRTLLGPADRRGADRPNRRASGGQRAGGQRAQHLRLVRRRRCVYPAVGLRSRLDPRARVCTGRASRTSSFPLATACGLTAHSECRIPPLARRRPHHALRAPHARGLLVAARAVRRKLSRDQPTLSDVKRGPSIFGFRTEPRRLDR